MQHTRAIYRRRGQSIGGAGSLRAVHSITANQYLYNRHNINNNFKLCLLINQRLTTNLH
nr:MAG TPA: hypothetical protein [Caudoviricetes sp.]